MYSPFAGKGMGILNDDRVNKLRKSLAFLFEASVDDKTDVSVSIGFPLNLNSGGERNR